MPLNKITKLVVREFTADMAREHGVGFETVRKTVNVVAHVIDLGYEVAKIEKVNPAFGVGIKKDDAEPDLQFLTAAEVEELAEAIAIPRDRAGPGVKKPGLREDIMALIEAGNTQYAVAKKLGIGTSTVNYHVKRVEPTRDRYEELSFLVRFAAYTGLRIGELAALRPKDIKGRVVTVQASIVTVTKETAAEYGISDLRSRKSIKSSKVRPVPIPNFLLPDLEKLMKQRQPDEPLFQMPRGGRLHSTNINRRFLAPAAEAIGKPGFTFHDLRHTFASLMIDSGVDVKAVSEVLGHADTTITLKIYTHCFPGRALEHSDVLDAARTRALASR